MQPPLGVLGVVEQLLAFAAATVNLSAALIVASVRLDAATSDEQE